MSQGTATAAARDETRGLSAITPARLADSEYGAAFFLMAACFGRQARVWHFVDECGIDFRAMIRRGGFSHGETLLLQAAWALFNGGRPLDFRALVHVVDRRHWEILMTAIAIARGEARLNVSEFCAQVGLSTT